MRVVAEYEIVATLGEVSIRNTPTQVVAVSMELVQDTVTDTFRQFSGQLIVVEEKVKEQRCISGVDGDFSGETVLCQVNHFQLGVIEQASGNAPRHVVVVDLDSLKEREAVEVSGQRSEEGTVGEVDADDAAGVVAEDAVPAAGLAVLEPVVGGEPGGSVGGGVEGFEGGHVGVFAGWGVVSAGAVFVDYVGAVVLPDILNS